MDKPVHKAGKGLAVDSAIRREAHAPTQSPPSEQSRRGIEQNHKVKKLTTTGLRHCSTFLRDRCLTMNLNVLDTDSATIWQVVVGTLAVYALVAMLWGLQELIRRMKPNFIENRKRQEIKDSREENNIIGEESQTARSHKTTKRTNFPLVTSAHPSLIRKTIHRNQTIFPISEAHLFETQAPARVNIRLHKSRPGSPHEEYLRPSTKEKQRG